MTVNFKAARDFVYQNGVLWERNLFAYLFQDGDLSQLQHNLKGYQNADGGYGNAMEHDIRCPHSHPLALEYLLSVLAQYNVPVGNLLDGAVEWLERSRNEDGSLRNPPEVLDYPHAGWWDGGGQNIPASTVGLLTKFGKTTPTLRDSTAKWAAANLSPEQIRANEWLFMSYHAYDYYMNVDDAPNLEACRHATVETILDLAQKAPDDQTYSFFKFAPTPDSPVAKAAPEAFIRRKLDYLDSTQQEDGGWRDQHGLPQWYPMVTISNLYTLRNYGRKIGI
jgi:hypothetical protein